MGGPDPPPPTHQWLRPWTADHWLTTDFIEHTCSLEGEGLNWWINYAMRVMIHTRTKKNWLKSRDKIVHNTVPFCRRKTLQWRSGSTLCIHWIGRLPTAWVDRPTTYTRPDLLLKAFACTPAAAQLQMTPCSRSHRPRTCSVTTSRHDYAAVQLQERPQNFG